MISSGSKYWIMSNSFYHGGNSVLPNSCYCMNVSFQKSFPRKGIGKNLTKTFTEISVLGVQCLQTLTKNDKKST